jgi:glutathione synthase/RimK-type ligase-like ATP-grasp enzyme
MAGTIALATALDEPGITDSDRLYADALERRGWRVVAAAWNGPPKAFAGADAVVLRSTWGYHRALDRFRGWTEATAAATRLFNPIALVRWNLRKDYVGKLATAGIRVPQSHLVSCAAQAIDKVLADAGCDQAVVKPASGASGHSVELVKRATLLEQVADATLRRLGL